ISVFIDWNQNGILDDEGEVYVVATSTGDNGPHEIMIHVPDNALPGETRMRVVLTYDEPSQPCNPYFFFGEVEDYSVVVDGEIPPPSAYSWSEKFPNSAWELPS